MEIFVINASQMQSVAYASSCFAMVMNVRSKLTRAHAATSLFALTAHLWMCATFVWFDGVKGAWTRPNALIAVSAIARIA